MGLICLNKDLIKKKIITFLSFYSCLRNDAKTVNVITTACFSKVTKVSFFTFETTLCLLYSMSDSPVHSHLPLFLFRSLLQVLNSFWAKMMTRKMRVIQNQRQVCVMHVKPRQICSSVVLVL